MAKPQTIEEALELASKFQSKYHEALNERITAQAHAFAVLCKDLPNPNDMELKATIVAQRLEIARLNDLNLQNVAKIKELVAKIGTYKNLQQTLDKLKEK